MKATLEIDVPPGSEEKALKVLREAHEKSPTPRSRMEFVKTAKGKIVAVIVASDFTALRAIVTSVLRDLKVMLDVFAK